MSRSAHLTIPEDEVQYEAEFTQIGPSTCEGTHCASAQLPLGTRLKAIFTKEPNTPPKMLCPTCWDYYMNKTTTRRKLEATQPSPNVFSPTPGPKSIDQRGIRQQLIAAQRGRKSFYNDGVMGLISISN